MFLPKQIKIKVNQLAAKHRLNLVVLYGSRAKNRAHRLSDTDLAVRAVRPLSLKKILQLSVEFDQLLAALGFLNCQAVDIRTAPPLLLAAIAKDGKVLYQSKQSDFALFKISAINQFLDIKPWLDLIAKRNHEAVLKLS